MAFEYKPYEESEAVAQARQLLARQEAARPGEYSSQWQDQLQKTVSDITNRPKFQYSMSSDPLYQQYKQQYMRNGKMAMQDTIGAAAAMNGGWGSSYAQTAGQQVYNGELQKLNDRLPELYGMALEKYQMEGNDLLSRYSVLGDMENRDYSRHQDKMAQWNVDRSYAADQFNNERSWDYGQYSDSFNRDFSIDQYNTANARYESEMAMEEARYNQALAQKQVDYLISIGADVPEGLAAAAGYDAGYLASISAQRAAMMGGYGGYYTPPAATDDKSVTRKPGNTQADINAAAANALRAGYDKDSVIEALKDRGVSQTAASEAARVWEKKEDILANAIGGDETWRYYLG